MEVTFRGQQLVQQRLNELAARGQLSMSVALREVAEEEMTEAKERTPVKWGNLKRSGHVVERGGVFGGDQLEVGLRFGNSAVQYAAPVHENLDAFHPVGQAKFLESTLAESAPFIAQRVANKMRRQWLLAREGEARAGVSPEHMSPDPGSMSWDFM